MDGRVRFKVVMNIIDVRDSSKFEEDHANGAVNFSHSEIEKGNFPDLAKDSEIVLYCGSGNKAARMREKFEQAGFSNVTSTSLPALRRSQNK